MQLSIQLTSGAGVDSKLGHRSSRDFTRDIPLHILEVFDDRRATLTFDFLLLVRYVSNVPKRSI